ncbi:MAG: transcription repressor NadR [Oscillospiraceae bacterium]|nr:transcription repressor NadR [Oscillospiraceae bacterium]
MKVQIRRDEILTRLNLADAPVSATALASIFGVSRQIIVKDISALREEGYAINALSKGYVLDKKPSPTRVFKTIHSDEDVERELNLIVDLGGVVEDVFIYHKAYNKVSAEMNIRTRLDVSKFIENITSGKSHLLKNVTSGYHYHTVTAKDTETLDLIEDSLWKAGFLAKLREFEPVEIDRKK